LLQLVIERGVKGRSVAVIAQNLITEFGGLEKIAETSLSELSSIKGIGTANATKLKAVFEIARRLKIQEKVYKGKELANPEAVADLVRSRLKDFKKEHFYLICLDSRNNPINEISIGTLDSNLVHPREVFAEAIKNRAASAIIAHNHPSGSIEPSDADIEITKQLTDAGKLLDIHILDHVIVTKENYFSFKRKKLI
jgi:DNA repair protein RadC